MDVVVVAQPTDICIPCKVLREIIGHGTFRANRNFGYDHIGKNFHGVNSAGELSQLNDQTFYAMLFPNLNDAQRSMFYSGQYEIMLKHNEGQEKFFILFGKKGQSMDDIEPVLYLLFPLYSIINN